MQKSARKIENRPNIFKNSNFPFELSAQTNFLLVKITLPAGCPQVPRRLPVGCPHLWAPVGPLGPHVSPRAPLNFFLGPHGDPIPNTEYGTPWGPRPTGGEKMFAAEPRIFFSVGYHIGPQGGALGPLGPMGDPLYCPAQVPPRMPGYIRFITR